MSLAVVRCPGCRGASRVPVDALGHMVGCPQCLVPFVAEEEIPVVQPVARPAPPPPPLPPRPVRPARSAVPVSPPRRPLVEVEEAPLEPTDATAPAIPDPEHDPHLPPVAGLPVSVLVGLALLPFGIPLLWWAAPLATGQVAALSLAVPVSLAVAASALCLGVVYTIDWTAATRIKGVLMLVGLAYLSAAGLFFLKKDMMDRVRAWGANPNRWQEIRSANEGDFKIQMPASAVADNNQKPWAGLAVAAGWRAQYVPDPQEPEPVYEYRFAVSKPDPRANRPDAAWFDQVRDRLKQELGEPTSQTNLWHQERPDAPGRQWTFDRGDRKARVVRVYAIKGRVYYLSAEGPGLTPEHEEFAAPFFNNFLVNIK